MRPVINGGARPRASAALPLLYTGRRGCSGSERRRSCTEFFARADDGGDGSRCGGQCALVSFIWPAHKAKAAAAQHGGRPEGPIPLLVAAAASASGIASTLVASHAALPAVTMACPPLLLTLPWAMAADDPPPPVAEETTRVSSRARCLQHSLVAACTAQAVAAALEFLINDPISGLIGCGISALGIHAASPQGDRYLPSYIVLAFCNGTMQVLLGLELAAARRALLHLAWPLSVKVGSVVSFASPLLMFVGLVMAWQLHTEIRELAVQNASGGPVPPQAAVDGAGLASGGFRPFSGEAHRLERM